MTRKVTILAFTAVASSAALFGLAGCSAEAATGSLMGPEAANEPSMSPESTAAEGNTWHHPASLMGSDTGGEFSLRALTVSAPEVAARLHGCTKLPVATLRTILASRGVNLGNTQDAASAAGILDRGRASLGGPNYPARVPELLFGTTASMSKQFDILFAASTEVVANLAASTGCKDVSLVVDNKLTKDGISCLLGKPAKDEHVTLANDLIAKAANPQDGVKLAVSALLSAAHSCE